MLDPGFYLEEDEEFSFAFGKKIYP